MVNILNFTMIFRYSYLIARLMCLSVQWNNHHAFLDKKKCRKVKADSRDAGETLPAHERQAAQNHEPRQAEN